MGWGAEVGGYKLFITKYMELVFPKTQQDNPGSARQLLLRPQHRLVHSPGPLLLAAVVFQVTASVETVFIMTALPPTPSYRPRLEPQAAISSPYRDGLETTQHLPKSV